jgi:hypothetical protein
MPLEGPQRPEWPGAGLGWPCVAVSAARISCKRDVLTEGAPLPGQSSRVGPHEKRLQYGQAKGLRGLAIDNELGFGRLLYVSAVSTHETEIRAG